MFIIVYPFPALIPNKLGYYFFTLEPHVSSFLEPDIVTMTQGFCSVSLVYAFALGLLMIGRQVRAGGPPFWLPLLLALMVAAEMRFRIHVFLPLMPGFLLLMVYFWIRSQKWSFALAIGACLLVSALLRLEMRSAAYLKSSSEVLFTFNGLARHIGFLNTWPFHQEIQNWLLSRLGETTTFNWTWQVVCMTAFVCLNICGIPMIIAVVVYLARSKSWTDHLPFTTIMLSLALGSLAGGILLNTTYDSYSLGGEMLINAAAYGFPIYCLLIWRIVNWLWMKWSPPPVVAGRVVLATLLVAVMAQYAYPITELRNTWVFTRGRIELSSATRGALAYLHDQTPPDSVVASVDFLNSETAVYSGIGGRACYVEYFDSPPGDHLPGAITTQTRLDRLSQIWNAQSDAEMRWALSATPISYLLEFSDHPFWVRHPSCLRSVWKGTDPDGSRVTVWEVLRPPA
jgi:hypothetical protein